MDRKGGWENVDGLGSEFANSSGVSKSELSNWKIVWKTVMSELASESMPDDVLMWGDSGGGKAKMEWWELSFGDWLDGKIEQWRDLTGRLIVG